MIGRFSRQLDYEKQMVLDACYLDVRSFVRSTRLIFKRLALSADVARCGVEWRLTNKP